MIVRKKKHLQPLVFFFCFKNVVHVKDTVFENAEENQDVILLAVSCTLAILCLL